MKTFTIERDDLPALTFPGELIASAASSVNTASPRYSGSTGRWTELRLYRTEGGAFVCSLVSYTQWQGERDRHGAVAVHDIESVVAFFGHSRLAKEVYEEAGLDVAERVA